jgi:hypothetical protein
MSKHFDMISFSGGEVNLSSPKIMRGLRALVWGVALDLVFHRFLLLSPPRSLPPQTSARRPARGFGVTLIASVLMGVEWLKDKCVVA